MNIHSLKIRYTVIFATTLSLIMSFLYYYLLPELEQEEIIEAQNTQQQFAKHLAQTFDADFRQKIKQIDSISHLEPIISLDKKEMDRTLSEASSISQFFNYYFIVDPQGTWLSYPDKPHLVGKKVKNEYWVKQSLNKKGIQYLDVHHAKTINKLVSGFVAPILSSDKSIIALLRGVITISDDNTLQERVKKIRFGLKKNGIAYMVDSSGKLLAHPDIPLTPQSFSKFDYSDFPPFQQSLKKKSGTVEYLYEGAKWLAAFELLPSTGWTLVVQQPKQDILQHAQEELRGFTKFVIIAFLFLALALAFFYKITLNPLTKLLQSIRSKESLNEQDFSKNEIGMLAQEFNKYHKNLEEMVHDRTEDIRRVNLELKDEIIERKEAETKLRDREFTMSSILRAAPVGIGVVNERIFTWVSSTLTDMLGYSEEEMIGQSARLLYTDEEEFQRVGRVKYDQLKSSAVGTVDTVWKRKNGTLIDVLLHSTPIDQEDMSKGVTFTALDITQRKKMEESLHRGHKLESLGILAGGIAHDFNNMLQAIMGNISLSMIYADPDSKVYKKLEEIGKAAQRATALTQQLLTFAKGGAPIKKTTALGQLIMEDVNFAIRGTSVVANFDLPEDLWMVDVDEGQFNQVVNNFVFNAVQAMPEGGSLSIIGKNMQVNDNELPPLESGSFIKISFVDQGVGIQPELLTKIFDPYFSTKQKGSGLGLAVCYSIIKNHSGLLTVDSKVGEGTSFTFYLPAREKQLEKTEEPKDENILLKVSTNILVMDDEPTVREIAQEMLEYLGCQVTTTTTGQETLEVYQKALQGDSSFSAVILDLTIPGGMGGKETLKKLREIDPNVTAIVSSGYSQDPIMSDYRQFGFQGVIPKPYSIELLSETLQSIVDEKG